MKSSQTERSNESLPKDDNKDLFKLYTLTLIIMIILSLLYTGG